MSSPGSWVWRGKYVWRPGVWIEYRPSWVWVPAHYCWTPLGFVFVEGWIRNAFDTEYIPVAFAYGQLAPSGFIGEMGRPRTFGISAGVTF